MTQRNPYVILGVPFGATREQANIAFARAARPLRRLGAAGRDRMTDLTWALNQIDEAIREPEAALWLYRIPADPGLLSPSGTGEFAPAPRRFGRRTGDSSAAVADLRRAAAQEFLRHLLTLQAGRVRAPHP